MAAGRQPPTFCKITPDYQSQRITPEINPKIIIEKLSQIPVAKTRKNTVVQNFREARGKLHLRENNCLGQIPFGGPRQC